MGDTPLPPAEAASAGDRLDSWKEIATYLRRGLATVQRWEKREGLPVHRHLHSKLGSVWARKSEIDAWWAERRPQLEPPAPSGVAEDGRSVPPRRRGPWLKLAGATLALAAALLLFLFLRGEGRGRWPLAARRVMIAVLPFDNLTGDPQQEFFCDGITEEMITQLGALDPEGLGVIARTSSMRLKGARRDVRDIGRELGVDYVLEGSVRREGDRVRIAAQLILTSDQTHLWAHNYERSVSDIMAVQAEVAMAVADQIQGQLSPRQQARLAAGRTVGHQAFEAYLRGRHALNRRTADSVGSAIRYFRTAIDADPAYAAPYAGLADCYNQLGTLAIGGQTPRETRHLARSAAKKALAIDDQLAEAHAALGYSDLYDWRWKDAESSLRRALELNPSYPWAHLWYASYLLVHGQNDEAIRSAERALELDPLSPIVETQLGWLLNFAGREDEALRHFERVLQTDPEFVWALWQKGSICLQKSRYNEAIVVLEKAVAVSGRNPAMLGRLGEGLAMAGRTAEAERVLAELTELSRNRYVSPLAFMAVYQGLNRRDEFFQWTEKAFEERANGVLWLRLWPLHRSMQDDPRYHDLLRRMNYPTR